MTISAILNAICPLTPDTVSILESIVEEVEHPKGKLLLRANRVEQYVYFIKKGFARAFSAKRDRDVTFWFGKEGDSLLSMRSYIEELPGYENIELIEDCQLYRIKSSLLQQKFQEDIRIANWGRKFAEKEIMKTERRLINLQTGNATERYKELLEETPELVQRVPLGYIASYLGISAVSLSRIRADLKSFPSPDKK